jgi:hypothetical protein
MPSPLLPDTTLLSLPIPADVGPHRYCELLTPNGHSYARLLRDLNWNAKKFKRGWRDNAAICHADPDLRRENRARAPGWRPTFGQIGVGQIQLSPFGIAPGDLFLFFGLFRESSWENGHLRFCPHTRPFHAIYGWLRVAEIMQANDATAAHNIIARHAWLADHPHLCDMDYWTKRVTRNGANTLYVAESGACGAGTFNYTPQMRLSSVQHSASRWNIFPWLAGHDNRHFSRCADAGRLNKDQGIFDTHAGRWQELVVPSSKYPELSAWAADLVMSQQQLS